MTLVTSSWGRPIQGVSQQPPKVRLEGQATEQINAVSDVVQGLVRRPGTDRIATLTEALPENTAYYYYNRGTEEEYFVVVEPMELPRVFDIEGDELVVELGSPLNENYIRTQGPEQHLRFATISDYTFICNRIRVPAASSTKTPSLSNTAILNLQFADYGRDYNVYINGTLATGYRTPDGSDAAHIEFVDTSRVAWILFEGPDSGISTGTITGPGLKNLTGYTVTRRNNTLLITKDGGGSFSVTTQDGSDGKDFVAIQNSVKEVGDLPLYAPDGYQVEVLGTSTSQDDAFWLVAEGTKGDTTVWRESTGPDQSVGFDPAVMPMVLIRDRFEDGKAVFRLEQAPWEERKVGTDETNPFPSFIQDAEPITSVGTFQNRLRLTAGESVIYSRSNEFFNFFRKSVRTPLDDDPVDVYADTNQVNLLENSVVLDGDAVFFSRNGQFLQSGKEPMTKENATLQYASTFESIPECQPVAGGDVIFFAFSHGRFTGIREFFTDSFTDTKRARPVTDHVNEYIVGRAKQLVTSTNQNQLLVRAQEGGEVYVYNWLWQGPDRVQSSWGKWVFQGNVRFLAYENETIYLLIDRNGMMELEKIEVGDSDDVGLDFAVKLDRGFTSTATRQTDGSWEIPLPYEPNPGEELVLVRALGSDDAGVNIAFDREGNTARTAENLSRSNPSVSVVGGIRYTTIYEPTMPFVKDQRGRVIDRDRLLLNDVQINYDMTGLTFVTVTSDIGSVREYSFNGRRVGGISNIVGFAPLRPGEFSFPVRQDADKVTFRIETNSHLPFQLRDMEWRGRFTSRGRRV